MMPNIDYELNRIVRYTYQMAGYKNCKAIFNGVMSITDFAKFVYFEYCAIRYINSEEQHPVYYYLSKQNKQYYEAYHAENRARQDNDEDVLLYSYTWLYSKNYASFARSVLRYIETMLETRHIPESDSSVNVPSTKALQNLMDYKGISREDRLEGTPLSRTYFYQALCECAFKIKGTNKYEWLSKKRTSIRMIEKFYSDIDRFIKNFMLTNYSVQFTEEERRAYISKAINLVKLADRRKLDLIYDFALCLDENKPDYFSGKENGEGNKSNPENTQYRFSDLPPIFFDSVTVIPWIIELSDTESLKMFSELYKNFCQSNGTVSLGSPCICFDSYTRHFICGSEEECKIEAIRYYMIKLLAESVKNKLLQGEVDIEYSEKSFASFIHYYYNIFDIYRKKQEKRSVVKLTQNQASLIHEISYRLYPKSTSI